jgi:hypothetical protein
MNVFTGDPFSTFELTDALDKIPYVPAFLGGLGIFEPRPVRTETIAIEKRDQELAIVQTTPRGAPLPQGGKDPRDMRDFRTVRVAKGDVVNASEIQNIRAFGTTTELEQAQTEVMNRLAKLRRDVDLTHEHMRLGAVQGIVLDADGSTLINWFDEWDLSQPAEIDFDLDNASPASGAVRIKCNQVVRAVQRAAKGSWVPGRTYVMGLAGDTFWDQLTAHTEIRQTYLNQVAAQELRNDVGAPFGTFRYGGITWVNYQGTDDNSTVAVNTLKAHFFPVGANAAFQQAMSPGETFDWANTPGQNVYALLVNDKDRNMWIKPEVYSYPLFVCSRPEMLQRAKNT